MPLPNTERPTTGMNESTAAPPQPGAPPAAVRLTAAPLWQQVDEVLRFVSDLPGEAPTTTPGGPSALARSEQNWGSGASAIQLPGFVATDPSILRVVHVARQMAQTDWPILIYGETGTGKECLAQWIHRWSRRHAGPFLPVNCAALPETLAESEFFGCERGSYTGATASRAGYFECADRGTLLLDEISELPLSLQAKLLRVIEEQKVQRLGSARSRSLSVRVVALSNRPLEALVRAGRFRADLFHRLSVLQLQLPPLRQRRQDIPLLAEFFLEQARRELGNPALHLAPATMAWLVEQSWPGNVRQLRNAVFQAALLAHAQGDESVLRDHFRLGQATLAGSAEHQPQSAYSSVKDGAGLPAAADVAVTDSLIVSDAATDRQNHDGFTPTAPGCAGAVFWPTQTLRLEEIEQAAIREALRRTGGHRRRAAALLGISLRTLFNKLHRYQMIAGPRRACGPRSNGG